MTYSSVQISPSFKKRWRRWRPYLLLLAATIVALRISVADWNWIPSGSMNPTIVEGDVVFTNKLAYDFRVPLTSLKISRNDPQRGDIAVFQSPENATRLVKRIIGLPGDTLQMRNNALYLNGEAIDYQPLSDELAKDVPARFRPYSLFYEEFLGEHQHSIMVTPGTPALISNFPPIIIPEGKYFMLGDNRDFSRDSRMYGFVERKYFLGRVTRILLSFDHEDKQRPRGHRFFTYLR
ncbi:MAG: signal peptidase I [Verrucomicrobiota bacterium]